MHRIRAFEAKAMELFQEKLIRGSVHPYTGMEAIAVGVCSALGEQDYITSTHRGHGHSIAKGLDLKLMMAEITGRATGYCGGKGGSMHITAMRHGMLGADAIVAGSVAIATGAAYALRLQGKDAVVVSFFGDGASNQGIFHEAANLASVLAAPVIYVCENNQWAISTPFQDAVNVPDIAVRAAGLRLPGRGRRRQRLLRRPRGGGAGRRARPRRRRADADRGEDVPDHAALGRDAERQPAAGGARALALARPDRPLRRRRSSSGSSSRAERVAELEAEAVREVEEAADFALGSPFPDPEAARDGRLRAERVERRRPAAMSDRGRDARADHVGGAERGAPRGDAPRRRASS